MNEIRCPFCENRGREHARFCDACGTPLSGEHASHVVARGYRLESEGRFAKAIEEYESVLELEGTGGRVIQKHLGNLHFRLGHLRRAEAYLADACERDPLNPSLYHDLGVVRYHRGRFNEAVESFQRAVELEPNQHLSYFWMGNALYHEGYFAEAIEAFRELLDNYPNFTVGHFHLGVLYARQGRKEEAIEEFRRVLIGSPEDAAAKYYMAHEGARA